MTGASPLKLGMNHMVILNHELLFPQNLDLNYLM